jgi:hypothetical protein
VIGSGDKNGKDAGDAERVERTATSITNVGSTFIRATPMLVGGCLSLNPD